ncbi:ROK family protein [Lactococcus raffinolactis]|uniref:ROK family protein n=1 Tax=Pseudolactococcus raffinolactis TaxID=1366 RepID=UPI00077BBBA9|nr:ROK family protein [Lactococcus raffinolactis]PCS13170.1 Transcriptional regulator/sugar kinase, xylose operon regulator [Lactococcus raffinolactis]HBZ60671.1 ROK family protein [Lactococcus sp.]
MVKKANLDVVRENNRKLVLQTLFNSEKTSRSSISKAVGLQKSTVSSIFLDLEEEGFVQELGIGESSNVGGRKPSMIRFNRAYGYVLAFDMGVRHLRYTINRLSGEIISDGAIDIKSKKVATVFSEMKKIIESLDVQDTIKGLVGIAIAVHAPVFNNNIIYSPFFEFEDFDLVGELEKLTDVPVLIENEANLAAIFYRDYHVYNEEVEYKDFIALNIHNGIGVGIVCEGYVFRGVDGLAGEVGRTIVYDAKANLTGDRDLPRLEDLYSENAIIDRVATIKKVDTISREEFLELLIHQDAEVMPLIEEWEMAIAAFIYNLNQLYAPQAIFITSRIFDTCPEIAQETLVNVDRFNSVHKPDLIISDSSVQDASMLGAVALISRYVLGLQDHILKFSL